MLSSGEQGGYFAREQVGIAASNVNVYVVFQEQAVYHFLEIFHHLYLVKEEIVHLVWAQVLLYVRVQNFIVEERFVVEILEVEVLYLFFDTPSERSFSLNILSSDDLPQSYACYYLDDLLVSPFLQEIHVFFTSIIFSFMFYLFTFAIHFAFYLDC